MLLIAQKMAGACDISERKEKVSDSPLSILFFERMLSMNPSVRVEVTSRFPSLPCVPSLPIPAFYFSSPLPPAASPVAKAIAHAPGEVAAPVVRP